MPASRSISRSSSTKRTAELAGERGAERGLAGAAQADQRDAALARGFLVPELAHQPEHHVLEPVLRQPFQEAPDQAALDARVTLAEQLGEGHPQRAGDAAQQQDRRVAFAGLELREVALGNAAPRGTTPCAPCPVARALRGPRGRGSRGTPGRPLRVARSTPMRRNVRCGGRGRWSWRGRRVGGSAMQHIAIQRTIMQSLDRRQGRRHGQWSLLRVRRETPGAPAVAAMSRSRASRRAPEHDLLCLTCA